MKAMMILKKTKWLAVGLTALLAVLAGCDKTDNEIMVGKLRHDLYVECMNLAAKITRQSDDDVSDIIGECSNEAYYMANQMSK